MASRAITKLGVSLGVILFLIYIFGGGERMEKFLRQPLSNGVFLMVFLLGVVPYILLHLQDMDEHKKDKEQ